METKIWKRKKLDDVVGQIQFQSVRFAYQEVEVLKDINLDIRPGSIVALVGPSGSGKNYTDEI